MTKKLRVYFMGSGAIAVPILQILARPHEHLELVGVGTQPDRPAGRHKHLVTTPLGGAALQLGLEVDRIKHASSPEFEEYLRGLNIDFLVVVSFGQILKENILELPRIACINVHASILPKYRGASPIVAAIANRDSYTGITFMRMVRRLDAGGIYSILKLPLTYYERCTELENTLGLLAATGIGEVLQGIACGRLEPAPQDESRVTMTHKIKKEDGRIDWRLSAESIEAQIRAYYPWPGAQMTLAVNDREEHITIHSARIISDIYAQPGEIVRADKNGFIIACGAGALELLELVPAGRKEMSAAAYLNGLRGAVATVKVN